MNYQQQNQPSLPPEQLSKLIELLGKQPQANPTSPHYDRSYVDLLSSLNNSVSQPQPVQTPPPVMPTLEPVVTTPQPKYKVVRVADTIESINAVEVEMGAKNIFPSPDETKIFVKFWGNDGSIIPKVYVLQDGDASASQTEDPRIEDMQIRIEKLEDMVSKLKKQSSAKSKTPSKKPKPAVVAKKEESEVAENEESAG